MTVCLCVCCISPYTMFSHSSPCSSSFIIHHHHHHRHVICLTLHHPPILAIPSHPIPSISTLSLSLPLQVDPQSLYTVMVENVPLEYRLNVQFRNLFDTLFPGGKVHSSEVCVCQLTPSSEVTHPPT